MNGSELLLTLNAMGRLVVRGDMHRLASYFACPLPFYAGESFILFSCRRKLAEALQIFHLAARRGGVRRIAPQVVRLEDCTRRRCLVVIRWDHIRSDGSIRTGGTVRYICRRGAISGRITIELVEYIEPGPKRFEDRLRRVIVG